MVSDLLVSLHLPRYLPKSPPKSVVHSFALYGVSKSGNIIYMVTALISNACLWYVKGPGTLGVSAEIHIVFVINQRMRCFEFVLIF